MALALDERWVAVGRNEAGEVGLGTEEGSAGHRRWEPVPRRRVHLPQI